MKVLIVVHDYLPDHLGGTELHAHQVAVELQRRGHTAVAAFTERRPDRPEGELTEGELDGVRTIEMVHSREYEHVRQTFQPGFSSKVFEGILERERPDVVHFHHLAFWGAECLSVARRLGIPVIVTLHDYWTICDAATLLKKNGEVCTAGPKRQCSECIEWYPYPHNHPDSRLFRYRFREELRARFELHEHHLKHVPVVIAPSRFLIDKLIEAGLIVEAQAKVLKTGYPGERRPARVAPAEGPLRLGYVGGIYESKGVHVLVEAMGHLQEMGVPATLEIFGILEWFPDYVERLRVMSEGLPVEFKGRYEPDQVDQVLDRFDALVVPSVWYENMPITIHEAFRNGLPVLASDFGGMAEAVKEGQGGRLFPRGDARALARMVAELHADRGQLEKLAAARPPIPELTEVVDELLRVYARVQTNAEVNA